MQVSRMTPIRPTAPSRAKPAVAVFIEQGTQKRSEQRGISNGRQVRKSLRVRFSSCLVRRDISAALLLLTDNVVLYYSNGAVIMGKDAFAAAMTANWEIIADYEYST